MTARKKSYTLIRYMSTFFSNRADNAGRRTEYLSTAPVYQNGSAAEPHFSCRFSARKTFKRTIAGRFL